MDEIKKLFNIFIFSPRYFYIQIRMKVVRHSLPQEKSLSKLTELEIVMRRTLASYSVDLT